MPSLAGITYWELHDGSGEVEFSDKSTAKRVLKCAWADRSNFVRALRGYTTIVDGVLILYGAQPHPTYADLFPDKITCSPMGRSSGEDTYQFAKLTVNYKQFEYDPSSTDPEDLYSERLRTSYEVLTIPGEVYNSEGGSYPGKELQITIPKIEYDLTIHRVPTFPLPKVIAFMGADSKPKVNSTVFRGAAAGHMLFLGADADRKTTTLGVEDWQVTYHFLYSHIAHNKAFNPATGNIAEVTHKASGEKLYDEGDFNELFYT